MWTWSWDVSRKLGIIGWDLGGAHLKMAVLDAQGGLQWIAQRATPLWQGLQPLDDAFCDLGKRVEFSAFDHVLTMTGELADLFENRTVGVATLAAFVAERLPAGSLRLYAGPLEFVDPAQSASLYRNIASANWYASAAWLAATRGEGLLVDIGSTTTDLLPFHGRVVCNRGYSDRERLACEELVYTGVVRTPVMAVVQRVPFAGDWMAVASEHFATMADVYRVLEVLPDGADQYPSADGRDKDTTSSMRRLARMIGADLGDVSVDSWRALAAFVAERQLDLIADACWRQLSVAPTLSLPLYAAGAGRFLVPRLAQRLGRECHDVDTLIGAPASGGGSGADCVPAVAIAQLVAMQRLACAC